MNARLPSPLFILALSLVPALAACKGDDTGGSDDVASTDESDSAATESDSGGPPPESPAHGITLDLVEINQGVAIPLIVDGAWVTGEERNAPIVGSRPTLLRAYWQTDADFEAREIEARLFVELPGGEVFEQRQTRLIDKAAFPGDLTRSFTFGLEPEMVPNLRVSLELWEVDAAYAAMEPPAVAPVFPADGSRALVGVQEQALAMKIVIVPVEVAWPGCSATVDPAPMMQRFEDMMYMKNPTQQVTLTLREQAIVADSEPSSLWELMPLIQAAREADAAAANEYYFALMDACGTGDIG
ncbi:MAG: hypothetical protein KC457_27685, partial [Myxococcales bacterium]|nr:hypothetical protein [Myxococcales bacterium]